MEHEVIIVGAGPAGLSVGACLYQHGIEALILEREREVASTWRKHYDRLHLHTVKRFSTLPHHPWPEDVPTYPSREQVVDYLTDYARRFPQPMRLGEELWRAQRVDGGWELETDHDHLRTRRLVIATGYNRRRHVPHWPGESTFTGDILHSSAYRNGAPWKGRRALVVGSGNSGAEIAIDLWEHGARTVDLCVRGPVHVMPRDLLGTPTQITGILLSPLPNAVADRIALAMLDRFVGDLSPLGLPRPDRGPAALMAATGRVPLIDVGTLPLIRQGHVRVRPGIERFDGSTVRFVDGQAHDYDLVLLATGYRAAIADYLDEAEEVLDERGLPRQIGTESELHGLYFVGYKNRPVGLLNDIATDARAIADDIASKTPGQPQHRRWAALISGIRSRLATS